MTWPSSAAHASPADEWVLNRALGEGDAYGASDAPQGFKEERCELARVGDDAARGGEGKPQTPIIRKEAETRPLSASRRGRKQRYLTA